MRRSSFQQLRWHYTGRGMSIFLYWRDNTRGASWCYLFIIFMKKNHGIYYSWDHSSQYLNNNLTIEIFKQTKWHNIRYSIWFGLGFSAPSLWPLRRGWIALGKWDSAVVQKEIQLWRLSDRRTRWSWCLESPHRRVMRMPSQYRLPFLRVDTDTIRVLSRSLTIITCILIFLLAA